MTVQMISGLPVPQTSNSQTRQGDFVNELGKALSRGIDTVNGLENDADQLALQLAMGELEDIHELTIATQKAQIALQTAVEIRNKVVESYQEIARMQI